MTYEENIQMRTIISRSLVYEGGFVDNKFDTGGMTYMGVSRKNFPNWEGWKKIDAILKKRRIKKGEIINDSALTECVMKFYEQNFFKKIIGTLKITPETEPIIGLMLDYGIHSSPKTAIKKIQYCINKLNGKDVVVEDGIQGPNTSKAIMSLNLSDLAAHYLEVRHQYLKAVAQKNQNHIFYTGWMNRLEKLARLYKIEKLTNW